MTTLHSGAAFALVLFLAAAPAHAQEAERPDFTGVWELASPPMTRTNQYPDLPFTEEGLTHIEAHRALVDPRGENPGMYCVIAGMPEMMMAAGGYPMEVIQKPDQVTLISENENDIRRLYLGDRIVPDSDIFPSRNGYSKARWEGDVLVVETAHLEEQPDSRFPHSAATTIDERFSLTEEDGEPRLVIETVVTDPEWLTEPLEYTLEYRPYDIGWIMPYTCTVQAWLDHLDELAAEAGQ